MQLSHTRQGTIQNRNGHISNLYGALWDSHIPQCTIQNRNVHIFVLYGALWDMVQDIMGFVRLVGHPSKSIGEGGKQESQDKNFRTTKNNFSKSCR